MVLCIVALFVFAILGIFSVRYRKLAVEAFDCAVRKVVFRPCESKLDERIRSKIVAKVLVKSPKAASFLNKNFEVFSLALFVLTLSSTGYIIYGVYNLLTIGTCDPITGTCIFSPLGANVTDTKPVCAHTGFTEFYGEGCPHCEKMEPIVAEVEVETGVVFEKLEIYYNETNLQEMLTHANDIEQDCGILGTPTFFSTKTNKSICGEVSKARLKAFILQNG